MAVYVCIPSADEIQSSHAYRGNNAGGSTAMQGQSAGYMYYLSSPLSTWEQAPSGSRGLFSLDLNALMKDPNMYLVSIGGTSLHWYCTWYMVSRVNLSLCTTGLSNCFVSVSVC